MGRQSVCLALGIVLLIGSSVLAQKQLVIGDIKIVGNEKTDPRVILTEMWIGKGDLYSEGAVEEARQRVMNLRYFQSVEIVSEKDEAAGVVNLTVKVKERITWGIVPIVQLDGDEPDNNKYGLRLEENNLFGLGKGILFAGSATKETTGYRLSYSDPQVLYSRFRAGAGLYLTTLDRDQQYDDEIVGGYITGGYRPTYETAVALQFSVRQDDYSDVNALAWPNLPDDAQTTKVALVMSYSDVDYHIDSVTGIGASLVIQKGVEAAGGDYEFTKSILGLSYSRTMIRDHWLRLRASGGTGNDLDKVHDGHEYFAVGGGSSIRGYPPNYRRGDRFVVLSAQYEIPVWHPAMFGFTGTVSAVGFIDYGDAWLENVGNDDFITGAGVGVRAYVNELQAFTFVLDVGYGFEEEEFQPHLTFGGSF